MLAFTPLSSHRFGWEAVTAGAFMLLGILAFVPVRHLIKRAKLINAYAIFTLSASAYLAVAVVDPGRLKNSADTVTWWLNRAVVGAMLYVAVRVVDRLVIVPMFSRGGTTQVPRFIHQLILIVLSIFVILMYGKAAFGWPIADFLTGGAVVSIVIGLALQESLGNLFSGLVLQAAPPFVLGDFIQAGHLEGRVVDMTWRAVTLHTTDDNYVVIPNGTIARQEIVNFHAPNTNSARMVKIGLDSDLPPCDAVAVLQRAALETNGVQATPPPAIVMLEYADSSIIYGIKFWINEPQRHLRVEHEVRMHAWYRLKEKGYMIPNPIRTVEVVNYREKTRRERESYIALREETFINIPLLEPLSPPQKRMLAEGASNVQLAPGQILFEQDDAGDSLFVIRKGKAEVLVRSADGEPSLLATLNTGDVIGEMSALTGQPRTATIRAVTALSMVQIDKRDFQRLIDSDPSVMEKISGLIARRNLEREQHLQGKAAAAPEAQAIAVQQQSLLERMIRFFKT